MRKSRFNEEQIVTILKEADAGVPIGEFYAYCAYVGQC
jgi:hypothetical protein